MMWRLSPAAGIPRLHPHLLRRTPTAQYLVNGGDAISLQHGLGLSGLEMANRYIRFASAELAEIQERVAPTDNLEIKPMRVPSETEVGRNEDPCCLLLSLVVEVCCLGCAL